MHQNRPDLSLPYEALIGDPKNFSRRAHLVEFFSTDSQIIKGITQFVFAGINGGEGVIVVGSNDHNDGVRANLLRLEIGVDAAIRSRQIVFLDADETLSNLMDGEKPDREKFFGTIGVLMEEMTLAFPLVRAYGEMVDILASRANLKAALELEQLWNELAKMRSFSLLCGYKADSLKDEDRTALAQVCSCHTHTISLGPLAGDVAI